MWELGLRDWQGGRVRPCESMGLAGVRCMHVSIEGLAGGRVRPQEVWGADRGSGAPVGGVRD